MLNRRVSRILVLVCLAAALVPAWAAAQDAPDPNELQRRREELERMRPEELQALKRKFEEFQKLAPAEQERLRRFHRTVEADPKLRQTLAGYHRWAAGLTEEERRQLHETPRGKRLELVREIMRRQAERDTLRATGAGGQPGRSFGPRFRPELPPELAEWYLEKLRPKLPPEEASKLVQLPPSNQRRDVGRCQRGIVQAPGCCQQKLAPA